MAVTITEHEFIHTSNERAVSLELNANFTALKEATEALQTAVAALPESADVDTAIADAIGPLETALAADPFEITGHLLLPNAAEVAAEAANRGRIALVHGGEGAADTLRVCVKKADDSYEWISLI